MFAYHKLYTAPPFFPPPMYTNWNKLIVAQVQKGMFGICLDHTAHISWDISK